MDSDIVVIGAGPAGLAVAAALIRGGLRPEVLERADAVGSSWRSHYERLHLHTVKSLSALPGLAFAAHLPRYVPRQGVVDYLAGYARHAGIAPCFGTEVRSVAPAGAERWLVTAADGRAWRARAVVVTTGANNLPFQPRLDGADDFAGRVMHSRDYRSGAAFAGRRVLVVGMGNTGAEIALDLAEHGVAVALSVRSPVNIVLRDVLGRPTQKTSMLLGRLPTALGDAVARLLRDLTVGDLGRYGLRRATTSPLHDLRVHGRTPVIDVGTLARIRSGDIAVHPGIERLTAHGARFVDGREAAFDTVILATGYRSGIAAIFAPTRVPVDEHGLPTAAIGQGELAGTYFVGFDTRQPGGLLRTIGQQALTVAAAVQARIERPDRERAAA